MSDCNPNTSRTLGSKILAFLFVDNFDKIAAGAPGVCYVPFRALLFRRRSVRAVRATISGGMVPVTENEVESDTPSRTLVRKY